VNGTVLSSLVKGSTFHYNMSLANFSNLKRGCIHGQFHLYLMALVSYTDYSYSLAPAQSSQASAYPHSHPPSSKSSVKSRFCPRRRLAEIVSGQRPSSTILRDLRWHFWEKVLVFGGLHHSLRPGDDSPKCL
jgi:hypothetical protein